MSEIDLIGVFLRTLEQVRTETFAQLYAAIPAGTATHRPAVNIFSGVDDSVGANVVFFATRHDGRALFWCVEVWFFPLGDDRWQATVKGEIDLDDDDGGDRCVVNEQVGVTTAEELIVAIRRHAELVAAYPLGELLTMPWPALPAELPERSGGTVTLTVTVASSDAEQS